MVVLSPKNDCACTNMNVDWSFNDVVSLWYSRMIVVFKEGNIVLSFKSIELGVGK